MIAKTSIEVEGRPASVWTGGEGQAIVLIHGGWGGAAMHWERVWERLADGHRVVAPEMPGIGDPLQPGLESFSAYGRWVLSLMTALDIDQACVVGNSFGAGVAWSLAVQAPVRCRGLVLVNGGPAQKLPGAVRVLLGLPPFAQLVTGLFRWMSFSPSTLTRAFSDPGRAPSELVSVLAGRRRVTPSFLELLRKLMLSEEASSGPPHCPVLLLWGEDDGLPGNNGDGARRLQKQIPGSDLVLISDAGHLPQVEQPDQFAEALKRFVEGHT